MPISPSLSRNQLSKIILPLVIICSLSWIYWHKQPSIPYFHSTDLELGIDGSDVGLDKDYLRRLREVEGLCEREQHSYREEYGRANLRMARSYDGSGTRLKKVLDKALHGHPIQISVLGGSITGGHQIYQSEVWFKLFVDWFKKVIPHDKTEGFNGAVPATGSDYFSFCFSEHIPLTSDLIFIELAVNDEPQQEHYENMENLLRGLLDLPHKPAVILMDALTLNSESMMYGGDIHMPVAVYYDVPVISMRNPLAPHMSNHPELIWPYFTKNWWQQPDLRHVNARGHRDMSRLAESLVLDMACEMVDDFNVNTNTQVGGRGGNESGLPLVFTKEVPQQTESWGPFQIGEAEPGTMLGCWPKEKEMGALPRVRFNQRWNEKDINLSLQPQCFSTRSEAHHLTPTTTDGFIEWSHQDRPDKIYLYSNEPGSSFTFDIETRLGVIKMYSLRSKTFGLGSLWCWVGEDREDGVRTDGYWENGDANIGRFSTIKTGLQPGLHTVSCELMEETADPDGGTEFRIVSIMSL